MKSVLVASVCFCVTWCQAADEGAPSVRPLSDEDFAAGIVLTKIGTGEAFDFSAPEGAEVCADWEAFGAARDWFRLDFGVADDVDEYASEGWSFAMDTNRVDSFTVFSYGTVRPSVTNVNTCISPLNAVIGIVPVSNHGMLDAEDRPSRFWHYLTPSNTLQLTWQNVLLGREVSKPVSFQAEIDMLGNVTFKYDLSRLPEEALTNLSVGVMNDGRGRRFSYLPRDITSLRWRYLNPSLPNFSDHDGDGISTLDELFVYGTDPYSADTDRDGLTDGEEIAVMKTNPTDRYSSDPRFTDSVASALGGADPYSCPNGDGRTAFENVVYTGSSTGRGGEPVSDRFTAVLKVSAVGSGRGVLMVGDQMVPLLQGVNPIKVAVPRGVRINLKSELEGELYLNFDSADFCIGELPFGGRTRGWIAFPFTEASHPCLHVLDEDAVVVSLDPGADIEDLTCTWSAEGAAVEVVNHPPLSASVTARFSRKSTSQVSYRLSHPDYLFGEAVFRQTCEYCPKIEDEPGYSSTDDYPNDQLDSAEFEDGTWCWEHNCYYSDCRYMHEQELYGRSSLVDDSVTNDYHTAVNSPDQYAAVLKLHRSYTEGENRDVRLIDVVVPEDKFQCCQCEEHWESHASIGYKSRHVAVHNGNAPFVRTTTNCTLSVFGVSPSEKIGDSRVSILTNCALYAEFDYTVFGVSILAGGVDLGRLNRLSSSFGMPVVINTNFANAVELKLCTDVNLPDGTVRLAFENPKARMQLWMEYTIGDYSGHEQHLLLLDSETRPELELSIAEWKRLVRRATFNRVTTLQLLAYDTGSVNLVFGYAGGEDGKYLHDEAVQTITAIRPPLLPDYNRDGKIDDADAFDYSNGRIKYFWANQDGWQGDNAFKGYSAGWWDIDWNVPDLPKSSWDDEVNGKNDLVNWCPFAVDLSRFAAHWTDKVTFEFVTGSPGMIRFVPIETCWTNVRSIVHTPQKVIDSDIAFHKAKIMYNEQDGERNEVPYQIPVSLLKLCYRSCGVLAVEFAEPNDNAVLRIRIREKRSGDIVCEFPMRARILDVHDMYRWINLFGVCGESVGKKFDDRLNVKWPDNEHADANVVFVHGYNMHHTEAWDWSQAMFKRLWWYGMDAGFTAVAWRGNQSQCWGSFLKTYFTKNYHQNVLNAFRTAETFSERMVSDVPGVKKYYIAHSLGNMLVSAARQDYGLKYEKYIMLNAAVALEAYDPGGVTEESKINMTPVEWRPYPDRVRATHWFELFSPDDIRRKLTWKGRFKDVDNTVNFYSSKDEVVANGNDDVDELLTRKFAWYNQENDKGGHLVDCCPEAGWSFNDEYKKYDVLGFLPRDYRADEVKEIADFELYENSFFGLFSHHGIYGDGGDAYLRNKQNAYAGWRALSHGMPAESFAVGANQVPKWNAKKRGGKEAQKRDAKNSEIRNVDMENDCGKHTGEWEHSYFIQMSLFDTCGLFDKITKIINKGRLIKEDNK